MFVEQFDNDLRNITDFCNSETFINELVLT